MATRRAMVQIAGSLAELPVGDTLVGASSPAAVRPRSVGSGTPRMPGIPGGTTGWMRRSIGYGDDDAYGAWWYTPSPIRILTMELRLFAAGGAGKLLDAAIYAANDDLQQGTRQGAVTTFDIASNVPATKTATVSIDLVPGWYLSTIVTNANIDLFVAQGVCNWFANGIDGEPQFVRRVFSSRLYSLGLPSDGTAIRWTSRDTGDQGIEHPITFTWDLL